MLHHTGLVLSVDLRWFSLKTQLFGIPMFRPEKHWFIVYSCQAKCRFMFMSINIYIAMTYPRYIPITGYPHTYPAAADCPRRQWGTKRKIRGPLVVSNRTLQWIRTGGARTGFPWFSQKLHSCLRNQWFLWCFWWVYHSINGVTYWRIAGITGISGHNSMGHVSDKCC